MINFNINDFKPVLIYASLKMYGGNKVAILRDYTNDIFMPKYFPYYSINEYPRVLAILGPKYMVLNMRRVFELHPGIAQYN
jgi:hypothetical protein